MPTVTTKNQSVVYCGGGGGGERMRTKHFVECMEKEMGEDKIYAKKIAMEMTDVDKESFEASTHCHICGNALGQDKVRDHDHLTGKFRGAAHSGCNLEFKLPKFVPIVFHNLSGYDAHIFVKELGFGEGKITCIPNTDEKYISFSKKVGDLEMRFIDSMRFMTCKLEILAGNLTKDKFKATQKCFGERSELMLRKGVYPYDYMDGPTKLEETQLPPKEEFTANSEMNILADEEYEHAQRVFKEFGCQNMRDYPQSLPGKRCSTYWKIFSKISGIFAWKTTGLIPHSTLHPQG